MMRPLGLFIGAYLEEKQLPHLFRAGGSFANWNKAAVDVRVLNPPTETGRKEYLPALCISETASRISRRHFWVVEGLHLKEAGKRFIIASFLKKCFRLEQTINYFGHIVFSQAGV